MLVASLLTSQVLNFNIFLFELTKVFILSNQLFGILIVVVLSILSSTSISWICISSLNSSSIIILKPAQLYLKEFLYLYCNPFEDSNIWAYLMKSSMFGEYRNDDASIGFFMTSIIMINVALICLSILNLFNFKRKDENNKLGTINVMFIIYYMIQIIVYIYGNIKMPYGCTMDFRYIVPNIFIGMFFIAQSLERKTKNNIIDVYTIIIMFTSLAVIFELAYLDSLYI